MNADAQEQVEDARRARLVAEVRSLTTSVGQTPAHALRRVLEEDAALPELLA